MTAPGPGRRDLLGPQRRLWCMKLAGQHVRHMIASGEDMETTLVTVTEDQLRRYAAELDESLAAK